MEVELSQIYLDPSERLRQKTFGNIRELAESISRYGQMQDIAVRPLTELDVDETDLPWKLIDGGRRFLAIEWCDRSGVEIPNLTPGHIGAKLLPVTDDLQALVMEFKANEDRMDFSWRERMGFFERYHSERLERSGGKWTQEETARELGVSQTTVQRYLFLASNPEALNHPSVTQADTLNTAVKQMQIVIDGIKREMVVKHRQRMLKGQKHGSGEESLLDSAKAGFEEGDGGSDLSGEGLVPVRSISDNIFDLCIHADLREWLPDQPDNHFDWFHWDPPYGGSQAGGAFAVHKKFDDTSSTALSLAEFAIPEIARVLRPGGWFALWHHPEFSRELQLYLQGHVRSDDGTVCRYCEKQWPIFDNPGNLANGCPAGEWAFWVNPYPFIWYKPNRKADGHEITRFRTNQYEQFWVAGKIDIDGLPILPDSSGGNVLVHDLPSRSERRHPTHKPESLLVEVLEIISIPGEFGGDCSVGSGSIFEAALESNRIAAGCELDREHWVSASYAFERKKRAVRSSCNGIGDVQPDNEE